MSNLVPGKRSGLTRSQRVDRASTFLMVGGASAVAFVVTFVLMLAGVLGAGLPLVTAAVAVGCGLGARRIIKR
jgi:CHASE2 domain-containing sensor protein